MSHKITDNPPPKWESKWRRVLKQLQPGQALIVYTTAERYQILSIAKKWGIKLTSYTGENRQYVFKLKV